ncbi:hypothetical protein HN937_29070, partial [Candidatus Poribacteria bacterium]|nr:hypothetical protein [Candidatus Poribacteria bacterium]
YDDAGDMEAPDSAPTIALVDQDGTDLSARLDSPTMSLISTGRYRAVYTATDSDDLEQLIWAFSVVEGGNTRIYPNTTIIVDTTAVDFTAADRTKLTAIDDLIKAAGDGDLAAMKIIIDNLPNSGALSDLADILTDTGTTLPATLVEIANALTAHDGNLSTVATAIAAIPTTKTGYVLAANGLATCQIDGVNADAFIAAVGAFSFGITVLDGTEVQYRNRDDDGTLVTVDHNTTGTRSTSVIAGD